MTGATVTEFFAVVGVAATCAIGLAAVLSPKLMALIAQWQTFFISRELENDRLRHANSAKSEVVGILTQAIEDTEAGPVKRAVEDRMACASPGAVTTLNAAVAVATQQTDARLGIAPASDNPQTPSGGG